MIIVGVVFLGFIMGEYYYVSLCEPEDLCAKYRVGVGGGGSWGGCNFDEICLIAIGVMCVGWC